MCFNIWLHEANSVSSLNLCLCQGSSQQSDVFCYVCFLIADNRTFKDRNIHRTSAAWNSLFWR